MYSSAKGGEKMLNPTLSEGTPAISLTQSPRLSRQRAELYSPLPLLSNRRRSPRRFRFMACRMACCMVANERCFSSNERRTFCIVSVTTR